MATVNMQNSMEMGELDIDIEEIDDRLEEL